MTMRYRELVELASFVSTTPVKRRDTATCVAQPFIRCMAVGSIASLSMGCATALYWLKSMAEIRHVIDTGSRQSCHEAN